MARAYPGGVAVLTVIAGSVLAISVLLAALLAARGRQRSQIRALRLLTGAARRVQRELDFELRVDSIPDDELGPLTDAFNAMLSALRTREQALTEQRTQLEQRLQERTHELEQQQRTLRLVLDHVDQGVLLLDRAGMPSGERSKSFDRWFGAPEPQQNFGQIIARAARGFDAQFAMQWGQLSEGFLPRALDLAQLPSTFATGDGNHFRLSYQAIGDDSERFDKVLVLVSDVTEHVERTHAHAQQAQIIALLEHLSADRAGFLTFFRDAEAAMTRLLGGEPREFDKVTRELHALKGNFGLFGFAPLSELLHAIEGACLERGEAPNELERERLRDAWQGLSSRAHACLSDTTRTINVDRRSLSALLSAVREQRPHPDLSQLAARLTREPVAPKLARLGERARVLADRLGKGPIEVDVEADGVLAACDLSWLWQVLPHVVANSVDHGLDPRDERAQAGKQTPAKLRIAAIEAPSGLVIEIEDDGRGIDWERVRTRAQRLGLPSSTREELVRALFADGVSTREQASEVSGRGIGLAAVEAACVENGASIGVISEPGKGTLFRFTVENDNHAAKRKSVA